MIFRAILPVSLLVLAACQAQPIVKAEADIVAASTSIPTDDLDECADREFNLEYTQCWQSLAKETRSQVEEISERAKKVAQISDEAERSDLKDAWLSDPVTNSITTWAEFSEQQCVTEGRTARGGTGTRALVAKCQYRLNNDRIDELEALVKRIEDF